MCHLLVMIGRHIWQALCYNQICRCTTDSSLQFQSAFHYMRGQILELPNQIAVAGLLQRISLWCLEYLEVPITLGGTSIYLSRSSHQRTHYYERIVGESYYIKALSTLRVPTIGEFITKILQVQSSNCQNKQQIESIN